MKRLSKDYFVGNEPDKNKVVGLRVENGSFYFLAWMENAATYSIMEAMRTDGYLIEKENIESSGDVVSAVQMADEYNDMYVLYEKDSDGNLVNKDEESYRNAHELFLEVISAQDIFELTNEELKSVCHTLPNGRYAFVIEDNEEAAV